MIDKAVLGKIMVHDRKIERTKTNTYINRLQKSEKKNLARAFATHFSFLKDRRILLRKVETRLMMKSWVKYSKDTDFPIQNLPYGVFKPGTKATPRIGVAVGDYVLDLAATSKAIKVSFFSSDFLLINKRYELTSSNNSDWILT